MNPVDKTPRSDSEPRDRPTMGQWATVVLYLGTVVVIVLAIPATIFAVDVLVHGWGGC